MTSRISIWFDTRFLRLLELSAIPSFSSEFGRKTYGPTRSSFLLRHACSLTTNLTGKYNIYFFLLVCATSENHNQWVTQIPLVPYRWGHFYPKTDLFYQDRKFSIKIFIIWQRWSLQKTLYWFAVTRTSTGTWGQKPEKYSHSITKSISLLFFLFRQPLCMCIHIFNVCLEQYSCPRIHLKRKWFFFDHCSNSFRPLKGPRLNEDCGNSDGQHTEDNQRNATFKCYTGMFVLHWPENTEKRLLPFWCQHVIMF